MLYVCATPIGNLEDITLRVLNTLRDCDVIAAEDTRHTRGLLTHYDIHKPLVSYHEHNKATAGPGLLERLRQGENVALVSDAGLPGISDPGADLVRQCRAEGLPVTVLPGASASVTALVLSGMDSRRFVFEGFLPPEKKERRERLAALATEERTILLYEAPHRLEKTLGELLEALGDRELTLVRELTKKFEEAQLATISQHLAALAEKGARGEYVLVISGGSPQPAAAAQPATTLAEDMQALLDAGVPEKEAMKQVAKARNLGKREVYRQWLLAKGKEEGEDDGC